MKYTPVQYFHDFCVLHFDSCIGNAKQFIGHETYVTVSVIVETPSLKHLFQKSRCWLLLLTTIFIIEKCFTSGQNF